MTNHMFSPQLAVKIGVNGALLLEYIIFWNDQNAISKTNFYDGCFWIRKSIKELHTIFPYLSQRIISNTLDTRKEFTNDPTESWSIIKMQKAIKLEIDTINTKLSKTEKKWLWESQMWIHKWKSNTILSKLNITFWKDKNQINKEVARVYISDWQKHTAILQWLITAATDAEQKELNTMITALEKSISQLENKIS